MEMAEDSTKIRWWLELQVSTRLNGFFKHAEFFKACTRLFLETDVCTLALEAIGIDPFFTNCKITEY